MLLEETTEHLSSLGHPGGDARIPLLSCLSSVSARLRFIKWAVHTRHHSTLRSQVGPYLRISHTVTAQGLETGDKDLAKARQKEMEEP